MESDPARTLPELAAKRDAVLSRIIALIEADERVVAAWLTGSFGRGEDDAWSDVDLHLAIDDAHFDAWWSDREARYRRIAPPLLIQREKPSNAQEGGRFQLVWFPGPVEVDWNVGPASLATRPPTSTMLLERIAIPVVVPLPMSAEDRRERLQQSVDRFWAMTPIAIKYAGRGATTKAVDQIDLLARTFTDVWWLLRDSANRVSKNPRLEPELVAIMPTLGPAIDPARCLDAIVGWMGAMGDLKPALAGAGVEWQVALESQVEVMVDVAGRVIVGGKNMR
jgi:hypothetical protein